jgi:hypothetical protein
MVFCVSFLHKPKKTAPTAIRTDEQKKPRPCETATDFTLRYLIERVGISLSKFKIIQYKYPSQIVTTINSFYDIARIPRGIESPPLL